VDVQMRRARGGHGPRLILSTGEDVTGPAPGCNPAICDDRQG
jgi:hypothetical protein